jgi:molybdenum cofactor biosynthesis enzyme MoaA
MDLDYKCENLELLTKEEMEDLLNAAQSTGVKNVKWSGLIKYSEE